LDVRGIFPKRMPHKKILHDMVTAWSYIWQTTTYEARGDILSAGM
jgi:hypothetical protein